LKGAKLGPWDSNIQTGEVIRYAHPQQSQFRRRLYRSSCPRQGYEGIFRGSNEILTCRIKRYGVFTLTLLRFQPEFSVLTSENTHPTCQLTEIRPKSLTECVISITNLSQNRLVGEHRSWQDIAIPKSFEQSTTYWVLSVTEYGSVAG
jgi:hypothetical protein